MKNISNMKCIFPVWQSNSTQLIPQLNKEWTTVTLGDSEQACLTGQLEKIKWDPDLIPFNQLFPISLQCQHLYPIQKTEN